MDEDGNPSDHPEPHALLAIAKIDPGKERYQYAHYRENHDLFKFRGHCPYLTDFPIREGRKTINKS